MICLISLVVFTVLGIFSAKYRKIAKEAFNCVFRRITLRKCTTGLDRRMKSQITGNVIRRFPSIGKFIYKNFETISWIFTIILILSLSYSAYSVYNLFAFGNCNGPITDAFCIFDPLIPRETQEECTLEGSVPGEITGVLKVLEDDPSIGPESAKVTIVEAGCFACPYTKQADPVVKQIISYYGDSIRFVYKDFPLSSIHRGAQEAAEASHCAYEQDMYWEYRDIIFENQENIDYDNLLKFAGTLNLDVDQFSECLTTRKYQSKVDSDFRRAFEIGVYGTPTFFINDQVIVGPKSFDELKQIIDSEFAKVV